MVYDGGVKTPSRVRFEDILDRMEAYLPELDEALLRHAYVFAAKRHQGQVRRSGEPYLTHPLMVAWILADMELDELAVAVGLLHDILEDTDTAEEEMEAEFGPEVTRAVVALTKMSGYESTFASREATVAENFRRLLLASMDDVRVILVKLADRLHNMRTLEYMRPERQRAIARETLDIYAPIANRLGIGSVKRELEDLCFRYLHPAEFERLRAELEERSAVVERWYSDLEAVLRKLLEGADIRGTIQGRVKHLYSIWQKLRRQGVSVANIFDFLAFRIIVDSVSECYAVLGLIHQEWPPVPGRIKDYIAIPKPNAYQSLHTTVLGPEGHPFEIQIRTWKMHEVAEHGIAAHWSYKEVGSDRHAEDGRITWLRSLLDTTEGSSPREFLDSLKVDLYPDEVYCFTPKGDVFSFPRGATVLDFAYRIHTEVGHQCTGARINGRWVPLKTELTNGDVVEIVTSAQQHPHRDWLTMVVTSRARGKIRAWLKREEKQHALEVGRRLLERELRRHRLTLKAVPDERLAEVAAAHGQAGKDELVAAVGFGKIDAAAVVESLYPRESGTELPRDVPPALAGDSKPAQGVLEVTGDSDFLVYLARCCNPVPGEDIVGYVTRGRGVAVHSRWCPNVRKLLYNPEREIEVRWAEGAEVAPSRVALHLAFTDRPGLLADISNAIADERGNILTCQLRADQPNGRGIGAITVEVRGAAHLERILKRLRSMESIVEVERQGLATGVEP